jgi:hypothetical protein
VADSPKKIPIKNFSLISVAILITLTILLTHSCKNEEVPIEYPSLKVANQTITSTFDIRSVTLVGYEFKNLNITTGSSQTFVLDKGMPAGYNNIYVTVSHYGIGQTRTTSIYINFKDGEVTSITLKG